MSQNKGSTDYTMVAQYKDIDAKIAKKGITSEQERQWHAYEQRVRWWGLPSRPEQKGWAREQRDEPLRNLTRRYCDGKNDWVNK